MDLDDMDKVAGGLRIYYGNRSVPGGGPDRAAFYAFWDEMEAKYHGVDLTDEELDQVAGAAAKAATKLDLDELDNVAGGASIGEWIAPLAGTGAIYGAMSGGLAGSVVPALGTAIGAAAGAAIGAVIGTVGGAVGYVICE